MNVASLTILDVLRAVFAAVAGSAGAGTDGAAEPEAVTGTDVGAGVPVRLGAPLTVKSLPCFSVIATGNSANLASSATGRRSLARAYNAAVAGLELPLSDHWYCRIKNESTRKRASEGRG